MRKGGAWAACLLAGFSLVSGCNLLSQYDRGREAARVEAENARRDYNTSAEQIIEMSLRGGGHLSDHPPEWRRGYIEGMRREFKHMDVPPGWEDVDRPVGSTCPASPSATGGP